MLGLPKFTAANYISAFNSRKNCDILQIASIKQPTLPNKKRLFFSEQESVTHTGILIFRII